MIVTIITSTYNCKNELNKTIYSIRKSIDLSDFRLQWIIIDGDSTDGTKDLIYENLDVIDNFISEPDNGIYDAWNKACNFIEGDWVIFLGAGDTLKHDNLNFFLQKLYAVDFSQTKIVYGNVELVDHDFRFLKKYSKLMDGNWADGRPSLPCHQGTFQHSSLFNGSDSFDSKYRIAADSKFLLLAMKNTKLAYIDVDVATMEMMGVSTNPNHILKVRNELSVLRSELNLSMPMLQLLKFNSRCFCKFFLSRFLDGKLFRFFTRIYCFIFSKEYLY